MTDKDNNGSFRLTQFIPMDKMTFDESSEDGDDTFTFSGVAHAYDKNLKHIILTKEGATFAAKNFGKGRNGKNHKLYLDHAYIAQGFGTAVPSLGVVGQVRAIQADDKKGLMYDADINTKHPYQIHHAVKRGDVDGVSVGIDINRKDVFCSECENQIFSSKCDHYIGERLDANSTKTVLGVVKKYLFDELSLTAQPADTKSTIRLSLNGSDGDSTIEDLNKEKAEMFKSQFNKKKSVNSMTNEGQKDTKTKEEYVSKVDFEEMKATLSELSKSVGNVGTILKAQSDESQLRLNAEKENVIVKILAKPDADFSKEELMTFGIDSLRKIEKITGVTEGTAPTGKTHVQNADIGDEGTEKFVLSREQKKAWARNAIA